MVLEERNPHYVSSQAANKSYRPKSYVMSPSLKRARAPFRLRNAIIGTSLFGFAVAVWAYSISAVKQDVFDDVDEEARALGGEARSAATLEDEHRAKAARPASSATVIPTETPVAAVKVAVHPTLSYSTFGTRGILARRLEQLFPRSLDPVTKTIVWGAPPVDKLGRLSESNGLQRGI